MMLAVLLLAAPAFVPPGSLPASVTRRHAALTLCEEKTPSPESSAPDSGAEEAPKVKPADWQLERQKKSPLWIQLAAGFAAFGLATGGIFEEQAYELWAPIREAGGYAAFLKLPSPPGIDQAKELKQKQKEAKWGQPLAQVDQVSLSD